MLTVFAAKDHEIVIYIYIYIYIYIGVYDNGSVMKKED